MRTPDPWLDVFLDLARTIARRSKDPSTQCGAVLVSADHRVLSTGFNGPPPQLDDMTVPWDERPAKYDFVIHAEENAILFALDSHGLAGVKGSTLYVNGEPCPGCVLRMIRAGVKRVIHTFDAKPKMVCETSRARVIRLLDSQTSPCLEVVRIGRG